MTINWDRTAKEIKKRRKRLRMTQDILAAKIGVRWNTISRIERGMIGSDQILGQRRRTARRRSFSCDQEKLTRS